VDHPILYVLKTELIRDGEVVDTREDRIGFREAEFRADGFYLNGEKLKLRGIDRHQSYPYVGYAMPESMQKYDADLLKTELGMNAVRTSHYPQSHHFLDRCDELGLLVFTEIPGWQHIGDKAWKNQAVENVREMVLQYRNHPSIILWGVRINESLDDDAFYAKTGAVAHELDPTRQTSGVRYLQNSSLLEDVYAFNDFSYNGETCGCLTKSEVTSDMSKGYLISEYNGHMFPTKSFDDEDHRTAHMLRHATVVDAYYGQSDIAGGFAWCMFDYNTHKDFGSGDRICYHGVMDMFRNRKLAGYLYGAQQEDVPVLEISSSMDIGEHPGGLMRDVYAVTNADAVRLYKDEQFIAEFPAEHTKFQNMPHGPILLDDFIGDRIQKEEGFSAEKAEDIKVILMAANQYGINSLPDHILALEQKCEMVHHLKSTDILEFYNKYVGNWGGKVTTYRFDAVKDGQVVKSVVKRPMERIVLHANVSHTDLKEGNTYDVASVRIQALSDCGNQLNYYQEPIMLTTSGSIALIGPSVVSFKGGAVGTYVKTIGEEGQGTLTISGESFAPVTITFTVTKA
jgi:beta-galactosidase